MDKEDHELEDKFQTNRFYADKFDRVHARLDQLRNEILASRQLNTDQHEKIEGQGKIAADLSAKIDTLFKNWEGFQRIIKIGQQIALWGLVVWIMTHIPEILASYSG